MTDFFGESRMTKQQRKHIAHRALIQVCAEFIAQGNFDKRLKETDYVEAMLENMSIKLGSVKREVICDAYKKAIADAKAAVKAKADAAAEAAEATK